MSENTPKSLTGPANFVRALPHLYGYYPDNSLVICAITANRIPGGIVSGELPADPATWDTLAREMISYLLENSAQFEGVHHIAAAICSSPDQQTYDENARHLHRAITHHLEAVSAAHSLPLVEVVYITRTHWWSAYCTDTTCCPPEGNEVPRRPDGTLWPTKAEVNADLAPEPEPAATEHRDAIERAKAALNAKIDNEGHRAVAREGVALVADAFAALATGSTLADLGADRAAHLLLLLQNREVQSQAIMRTEPDELEPAQRLWRGLARMCTEPHVEFAGVPLALYGLACWGSGNLPAARNALEASLRAEPGNDLAEILRDNLFVGQDFEVLRELCRAIGARAAR